jgi:hypothetical protein
MCRRTKVDRSIATIRTPMSSIAGDIPPVSGTSPPVLARSPAASASRSVSAAASSPSREAPPSSDPALVSSPAAAPALSPSSALPCAVSAPCASVLSCAPEHPLCGSDPPPRVWQANGMRSASRRSAIKPPVIQPRGLLARDPGPLQFAHERSSPIGSFAPPGRGDDPVIAPAPNCLYGREVLPGIVLLLLYLLPGLVPALVGLLDDVAGDALRPEPERYSGGQRHRAEDDQERRGGELHRYA